MNLVGPTSFSPQVPKGTTMNSCLNPRGIEIDVVQAIHFMKDFHSRLVAIQLFLRGFFLHSRQLTLHDIDQLASTLTVSARQQVAIILQRCLVLIQLVM